MAECPLPKPNTRVRFPSSAPNRLIHSPKSEWISFFIIGGSPMKSILVSACLLGTPCRYDGKSKPVKTICDLQKTHHLVPVCPEVFGGLPTPRIPSEIVGDRVLTKDGRDVTQNYQDGATKALEIARANKCEIAILKERSPSCGMGCIYSGNFDKTLVSGNGITTDLLLKNGIRVLGESMTDEINTL